jgi:hypothetical protein
LSFVCSECGATSGTPSKNQIRDAIRDHKAGWWFWEHEYAGYSDHVPGIGLIEIVHASYDGDDCEIVFKTGYGLFKLDGYYNSYSGPNWRESTFREVEEKIRTATYYD